MLDNSSRQITPDKEQGRGTGSRREPSPPPCLSRHARCRIQLAQSCRPRRLSQDACFGGSRFALSYGRDSPTAESDRGSRRPQQKSPIQPDPRRVDRSRTAVRLQGKPCAVGRAPESTPYRQERCPPRRFASSSCRKLAAPRNTVAAWGQSPMVANTFVFTGRLRRAPRPHYLPQAFPWHRCALTYPWVSTSFDEARRGRQRPLADSEIRFLVAAIIVVTAIALIFPVRWWVAARAAGVKVPLSALIWMRLRGTRPHRILAPLIAANRAGLDLNLAELEALHLAGGNVTHVVDALILAKENGVELDFRRAVAIDLAGRDLLWEINAVIVEATSGQRGNASTPSAETVRTQHEDDS